MPTSSKGVRRDAFVKSVRPDPKSTEDLVLLQGYIGDSDLTGHIRVYSDPVLSDFIELPEQDILYAEPVSTTEDPLGGSRLWVKKTTVFTAGDPRHANRVKSSFLEGDIVKAFGDTGKIPTVIVPNTFAAACQSVKPKSCCETQVAVCKTIFRTCQIPSCLQNCNQPSCRPTCVQPTCDRTCNQPSCDRTCQPSCIRTCDQQATCFQTGCGPDCPPSHFQTCQQPSCQQTCMTPSCNCSGPIICVVTQRGTANPPATTTCFAGGFNPYTTGY